MGLEFVTVGYRGTPDETEWQINNRDWFDKHHEFHDNSVGDYAVNVKRNIIKWQDDLRYDSDWNDLMEVIQKIARLHGRTFKYDPVELSKGTFQEDNEYLDVIALPLSTPISEAYKKVVQFIKFYNEQNKALQCTFPDSN